MSTCLSVHKPRCVCVKEEREVLQEARWVFRIRGSLCVHVTKHRQRGLVFNRDFTLNYSSFQGRKGDQGFRGAPGLKGGRVGRRGKDTRPSWSFGFYAAQWAWVSFQQGESGLNGRPGNDGPEVKKKKTSFYSFLIFSTHNVDMINHIIKKKPVLSPTGSSRLQGQQGGYLLSTSLTVSVKELRITREADVMCCLAGGERRLWDPRGEGWHRTAIIY